MNKKSKKLMGKRYVRFEKAKRSLKKHKIKPYSKKLIKHKRRHRNNRSNRSNRRNYRSKRYTRKRLNRRSYSMNGGGIPFGGTIKGLLGLTHSNEKSRENMIGNLCALNTVRPTTDSQLSGILNQVCNLDETVKKEKKDSGIVKGAMRLIGSMATLPLRTASSVVKNVTGFDASEAAYNAIKNTVSKEEQSSPPINLIPQVRQQPQALAQAKPLRGGQPLNIGNNQNIPQIQTGVNYSTMLGGDSSAIENIQKKLRDGGSLTADELRIVSSL